MFCKQKLSAVLALAVGCVQIALAQGGATGAISGTVQATSGAVLPGAKVVIISAATGELAREVATDSAGFYTATLLPVGTYSVEVSVAGFATVKYPNVVVRITETTRLDAVLGISTVKEVVEVQSQITPVDTTDATTGQSLASGTITSLPLATRNFQQLLALSAGASASLNDASQLGRGDVRIDVNGGREDNNNYLIEGITASDYAFGELSYTPLPNPDDLQEFKVSTSLYDATQGRNGGGNINAVLKSGTAQFHGDAWEYFRNTLLDANDFFLNAAGEARPVIKQNIFGADFGGPVGRKAKLGYFYLNYQGTRQRSGDSLGTYINSFIPVLPTNRSAANLIATFFPTGLPAGVTGLDPVAVNLLNFKSNQFGGGPGGFLIPSVPGTPGINPATGTYNTGALVLTDPGKFTDDQFTANWDREFRDGKDHLAERFFWSDTETYEPFGADNLQIQTGYPPAANNLNFPLDVPVKGRFGSLAETHLFTNALVNEARLGVNIIHDTFNNVPIVTPAEIGINNPSLAPDIYRFQFGNFQIGPYPTQTQSALSYTFVLLDTLSWTIGSHNLRLGGEADYTWIRRDLPVLDNGLLYFVPGGFGNLSDFQNFLLGTPSFGEAGGGAGNHDYRIPDFSLFAQDDWRFSKTLTLNLGVRVDWMGAAYDDLCHLGNTNPSLANLTGDGFVFPSCVSQYNIPGFSGTLNSAALNNEYATVWQPRIGLAYDVGGHHTTSIRTGYGIYGVREDIGAVDNLGFTAPFFPVAVTAVPPGGLANFFYTNPLVPPSATNPGLIPPLGVVSGAFLPTPSRLQGFVNAATGMPTSDTTQTPVFSGTAIDYIGLAVPLHWIVPTTQQWNFTLQRELGGNWFAEVGYVGTKGTHLRATYDPDEAQLANSSNPITVTAQNGTKYTITQNTVANANARAPYLGISPAAFEAFAPVSDSHYEGLNVTLAHRFSKGLYLQSAYTYSKSIDDVSTASVAFLTRINDQNDPLDSRGLSDFDRRNRWVTSFDYQLPILANRAAVVRTALGGWEASGVLTLQSGTPFTIYDTNGGTAIDLSSSPAITADITPGSSCANSYTTGSLGARLANWVQPAAFQPAPVVGPDGSTGFGDSPRNCLIGPPQKNLDFTIGKIFRITERQDLRFRTDFFNLTNHPSFANTLQNNVQSPNFTAITQTVGTPRLVQFSLKYSF